MNENKKVKKPISWLTGFWQYNL